ncbi:MAG: hypothetical protein U0586_07320 [Candidatus Brocadiaceae bacterium]
MAERIMKILLHSYPGYSYFLREVIYSARRKASPIEWSIIQYSNTDNLLDEFKILVGVENVLYLQSGLNEYMEGNEVNLDAMKDFPASLYECISTSKVVSGHIPLLSKSRDYQLKIITGTYVIYKEYLLRNRPDFVFFSIVDLYDSMILYHLCHELGITPIINGHARNLGVSYFTDSVYETLPPYAFKEDLSEENIKKAEDFIRSFSDNFKAPFEIKYQPNPDEIIDTSYLRKGIFKKVFKVIKRRLRGFEPHLVDRYTLIHHLRIHFHPLTRRWKTLKGDIIQRKFYDIKTIKELPEKFTYYPLQYTPETSINTPAPYFVDQLRAIDLILTSMPSDYYLVIKEHPAMKGERPVSFYRALKKKANVLLADFSLPSIEVIKKASLTISVTGTSCLEAFLLGKPSLHLGRAFFTDWIYQFDSFYHFREVTREALKNQNVPMEKIIDLVSRVFSVGFDFIVFSANSPYGNVDQLMNKRNINTFLESLLNHIKRLGNIEENNNADTQKRSACKK